MTATNEKETVVIKLIKELGIPTVICIAGIFGVIKVAGWTGENIIKPVNDELIQSIRQNRDDLKSTASTLKEEAILMDRILKRVDAIEAELRAIVDHKPTSMMDKSDAAKLAALDEERSKELSQKH